MSENQAENKNPKNNIGAIWKKESVNGEYLLFKVTLNGENHTLVAFKNVFKKDDQTSKVPDYYVFPFKPKQNKL